ncbi:hypothetical protein ABZ915_17425 [Streptomyces sp. NPDC046915]|uniref:hypothetical protein n=1 Tax=Streptomyces sp. NPDC046915 TaxID=3155257 RepID=UPI0033E1150F
MPTSSQTTAQPVIATVREIRHEVRIDLTDAPALTNIIGRTRKPVGLRITYGLRRDIAHVDITVEYGNAAELWPPVAEMPDWLNQIVADHMPRDVDAPEDFRPTGMAGWSIDATARGGAR